MSRMRNTVFVLCSIFTLKQAWAEEIAMPIVPLSVLKQDQSAFPSLPHPIATKTITPPLEKPTTVLMKPGVNQILPIALGHLNRIVTPFSQPKVTTTSTGKTEVRDHVIYLATDEAAPVSLFITEDQNESQALNLTLIPRRIPPREIFLKLAPGTCLPSNHANYQAQRWEVSQPYVQTIRALFRDLALGKVPQGYTLQTITHQTLPVACRQPGVAFDFSVGQKLVGHHLAVTVGVATNVSRYPLEFKEASCATGDVVAVAAWPRLTLQPGQRTEIYLAQSQKQTYTPASQRPSLLEEHP